VLSLVPLVVACASRPPDPVRSETVETLLGTVEAFDDHRRVLTLRNSVGDAVSVEIDPAVRSFAQVRVGDHVVVRHYSVLAAKLRRRGDASGETEAPVTTADVALAPEGARPGGVVGIQVHQTVRITDINKRNHVVSFYGSDGISRWLPVRTPQGREFISRLKVGDEVELTLTEGVAISVEPGT
jgi:hypothetical protein